MQCRNVCSKKTTSEAPSLFWHAPNNGVISSQPTNRIQPKTFTKTTVSSGGFLPAGNACSMSLTNQSSPDKKLSSPLAQMSPAFVFSSSPIAHSSKSNAGSNALLSSSSVSCHQPNNENMPCTSSPIVASLSSRTHLSSPTAIITGPHQKKLIKGANNEFEKIVLTELSALSILLKEVLQNVKTVNIQNQNHGLPLKTIEDLAVFEARIIEDDEYKNSIIFYVRKLKKQVSATLGDQFLRSIITDEAVISFNWSGKYGKKKLKDTFLFGNLIPTNVCGTCYDLRDYQKEIKSLINKAHQRHWQNVSANKKKQP